jgi:hypothetical protein
MPLRAGKIGLLKGPNFTRTKGISHLQLCHTSRATSAVFDDPNLVSSAGLVSIVTLARSAGLYELAEKHLTVPTDKARTQG